MFAFWQNNIGIFDNHYNDYNHIDEINDHNNDEINLKNIYEDVNKIKYYNDISQQFINNIMNRVEDLNNYNINLLTQFNELKLSQEIIINELVSKLSIKINELESNQFLPMINYAPCMNTSEIMYANKNNLTDFGIAYKNMKFFKNFKIIVYPILINQHLNCAQLINDYMWVDFIDGINRLTNVFNTPYIVHLYDWINKYSINMIDESGNNINKYIKKNYEYIKNKIIMDGQYPDNDGNLLITDLKYIYNITNRNTTTNDYHNSKLFFGDIDVL